MLNNKGTLTQYLHSLGLSVDEARLYLELLKGPSTHLKLARATGINRTKIYRLADELEKRSLVSVRTDDSGAFLVAADPATLEVELVTQEESLQRKRTVFSSILPELQNIRSGDEKTFVINTYEGVRGFKQMLWHELKAHNEILIFGSGTLGDLVDDARWSEKHRAMTIDAGYIIREIVNPGEKDKPFTIHQDFMSKFDLRYIPTAIFNIKTPIAIYNTTVATYNWRDGEKVGFEVINKTYADTMRQIFYTYWALATPGSKPQLLV